MTILEAHVSKENWSVLEQAYELGAQYRDAGLVQSFLIHSSKDAELWRILTVWRSQEALAEMRASGDTPRGVLMFRAAKAEPVLTIFQIVQQITLEWYVRPINPKLEIRMSGHVVLQLVAAPRWLTWVLGRAWMANGLRPIFLLFARYAGHFSRFQLVEIRPAQKLPVSP